MVDGKRNQLSFWPTTKRIPYEQGSVVPLNPDRIGQLFFSDEIHNTSDRTDNEDKSQRFNKMYFPFLVVFVPFRLLKSFPQIPLFSWILNKL
jgi:hypothetical protein